LQALQSGRARSNRHTAMRAEAVCHAECNGASFKVNASEAVEEMV
jgi:hypothetical protein